MLIPRRLLIENPIRFCEELEYDSDIPVLMEVLAKAPKTVYQEKGTYIKRKHNDPINLPSLLQKKDAAKKVAEAMKSYEMASRFVDKENGRAFHYRFAMCLVTMIAPFMIESKAAERKETAKELKQTLKQFRTACEQSQEELYQIAREKSYYVPAEKATAEEVAHVRSLFTQGTL